eukprot:154882-Chlamydomonas_euryale.AAC.1
MVGQGAVLPVELVRERIGGTLSGMQRAAAPPHDDSHAMLAHAAEELDPLVSLVRRPPRAAQGIAEVGGLLLLR